MPRPARHAEDCAELVGAFPEHAQHQCREEARRGQRECRADQEQDVARFQRSHPGREDRHHQQQALGHRQTAGGGGMRVDHLVVDVVRQRVGDGEQQAVSGGKRRSQTARRHQTRDHVGQAGDFRRGQHDQVAADGDFGQLHEAVLVEVGDAHQGRIHRRPRSHPLRQVSETRADQQVVDVELRQHCQGRSGEVQQEDEEQRPEHRLARLLHRWRGVVAHQDVRQRGGTHHQAQHQGEEVLALLVRLLVVLGLGLGDFFRRRRRVGPEQFLLGALACERFGVGLDRCGLGLGAVSGFLPGGLGRSGVSREALDGFLGCLDGFGIRSWRSLEIGQLGFDLGFLFGQVGGTAGFQPFQLGFRIFLFLA